MMRKKIRLYLLIGIIGVLLASCVKEFMDTPLSATEDEISPPYLTVSEAREFFENKYAAMCMTRHSGAHKSSGGLNPGEFTLFWNESQTSQNQYTGSVDVPILPQYRYRAVRSEFVNGRAKAYEVDVSQKLVVIKSKELKKNVYYLLALIPDYAYGQKNKGDICDEFLNSGDKGDFSGIAVYYSIENQKTVKINKYRQGVIVAGCSMLGDKSAIAQAVEKSRTILGPMRIIRQTHKIQTRNFGEEWGLEEGEECDVCGGNPCYCVECIICGYCMSDPCVCDLEEECPECGSFPCICDLMGCPVCGSDPCTCFDDLFCPDCGQYSCICEYECPLCNNYPCVCDEVCPDCNSTPCVCDDHELEPDPDPDPEIDDPSLRCATCGALFQCVCKSVESDNNTLKNLRIKFIDVNSKNKLEPLVSQISSRLLGDRILQRLNSDKKYNIIFEQKPHSPKVIADILVDRDIFYINVYRDNVDEVAIVEELLHLIQTRDNYIGPLGNREIEAKMAVYYYGTETKCDLGEASYLYNKVYEYYKNQTNENLMSLTEAMEIFGYGSHAYPIIPEQLDWSLYDFLKTNVN